MMPVCFGWGTQAFVRPSSRWRIDVLGGVQHIVRSVDRRPQGLVAPDRGAASVI